MQNIKNFKLVATTPQKTARLMSSLANTDFIPDVTPLFLESEDGQDWYESQRKFSDHTVKIMYDQNGIIRSVVDYPVAQRGNTLAVSMFFPENMSVAEINTALPEGFELDSGKWVFDGVGVFHISEIIDSEDDYKDVKKGIPLQG